MFALVRNHVQSQLLKCFKGLKLYATYKRHEMGMLQVHKNGISLRKRSARTAQLRASEENCGRV